MPRSLLLATRERNRPVLVAPPRPARDAARPRAEIDHDRGDAGRTLRRCVALVRVPADRVRMADVVAQHRLHVLDRDPADLRLEAVAGALMAEEAVRRDPVVDP